MVNMNEKIKQVNKMSNISKVLENTYKYLGHKHLSVSTRKDKKFMVLNPETLKYSHFGSINYKDFTKHQDMDRRDNYLKRAIGIKGDWKNDKYSPNNLSINILWN